MIGDLDRRAWERRYILIGVDEVGRGPVAGPVSAGAVIMDTDPEIEGINDSKKLSERKREELAKKIQDTCIHAVVHISHEKIDEHGIQSCTYEAMRRAVKEVYRLAIDRGAYAEIELQTRLWVLVDGPKELPKAPWRQRAITHGDSTSLAIAAGSIVAKVARDAIMRKYDKQWPQYGFARHKGYGTKEHLSALDEYGPCPIHRKSVRAVRRKEIRERWIEAQKRGADWHELQMLRF